MIRCLVCAEDWRTGRENPHTFGVRHGTRKTDSTRAWAYIGYRVIRADPNILLCINTSALPLQPLNSGRSEVVAQLSTTVLLTMAKNLYIGCSKASWRKIWDWTFSASDERLVKSSLGAGCITEIPDHLTELADRCPQQVPWPLAHHPSLGFGIEGGDQSGVQRLARELRVSCPFPHYLPHCNPHEEEFQETETSLWLSEAEPGPRRHMLNWVENLSFYFILDF